MGGTKGQRKGKMRPTQNKSEPKHRSRSPSPAHPTKMEAQDAPRTPSPAPTSSSNSTTSSSSSNASSPLHNSSTQTQEPTPHPNKPKIPNTDSGLLETTPAKTETDLIEALHLITDSIAQQRQTAASSILHHPLYWFLLIILFEYLYRLLYYGTEDWIIVGITWCGALMFSLNVVKVLAGKYLDEAERVGTWSWLFGDAWVKRWDWKEKSLVWSFADGVWVRVPGGDVEGWMKERDVKKWSEESSGSVSGSGSGSGSSNGSDGESAPGWQSYSEPPSRSGTPQPESEPEPEPELEPEPEPEPEPSPKADFQADFQAESMKEGWLRDWIFISKFKGRTIASLVMRIEPIDTNVVLRDPTQSPVRSSRDKAVIRAWTVQSVYRGFGVGKEILQYAIEFAKERGLEGPEFASDHANSMRLWLGLFNERMNRMDTKAREMLAREVAEYGEI